MVQSTASQSGYNCMVRPVRSRNSSMTSSQSRNEKSDKPSQRKSTSLPSETVEYLKAWMMSPEHIAHPYPTEQEKCQIMNDTGIELKQLTNWFVNNRKRYWKPRVEAQLKQKAQAAHTIPMTTNFDTERGFISSYLSVVPPDNHFPTPKRARTVAPPQSSSFVTHSYAVSDCSSSYEGDQVYQSNDETSDYDSNKLPHSISFNGDICIENQNVMENSLSFIHETESVTLHILRPSDEDTHPALEDVTILSNVPTECILRSYFDCIIEYDISRNIIGNLKEVSYMSSKVPPPLKITSFAHNKNLLCLLSHYRSKMYEMLLFLKRKSCTLTYISSPQSLYTLPKLSLTPLLNLTQVTRKVSRTKRVKLRNTVP